MFSDRHPKYNTFKQLRGGIYVIEGIIGAGKTTFGKSAEKYFNNIGLECKFFPEYVNSDLLTQFIQDMKKYAYPFQLCMLFKRIETYKEAEKFAKMGGIALVDRSIAGDMTFAKMHVDNENISIEEWNIYLAVLKSELLPSPSSCIYLKCSSEISLNRIKNRGRESEIDGYTLDYLNNLTNIYDNILQTQDNVIIINWNDSMTIINNELSEYDIENILHKLL